jgi:NAD(P)-dependent dehydrogenase (short-subunit alcohol dehydrogenase family)
MSQVWFITGVSTGFGLEIALQVLKHGSRVIGTVRSRERAAGAVEQIESQGGHVLELDVTHADACWDVWSQAEKIHGRVDVLCNNAGMSYLGAIEDFR